MLYRSERSTVPASQYGIVLDILEETGWTWDEWRAQPAALCDEMIVRFRKRAAEHNRQMKQQARAGHGKKR